MIWEMRTTIPRDSDGNFNALDSEYISTHRFSPIQKSWNNITLQLTSSRKSRRSATSMASSTTASPHLENVNLNSQSAMDKDNNAGALPIPNHVVLNHLATTSTKHGALAVSLYTLQT